jgi:hypothetical protein
MKNCIAARHGPFQRSTIAQVTVCDLGFNPFQIFPVAAGSDKQAQVRALLG